MLSRVAERVYWLARYLERAENTARLLTVYANLLLDLPRGTKLGWDTLLQIIGNETLFFDNYREPTEPNITRFLVTDARNHSSITSTLASARENARTTREIMPAEAWGRINGLYLTVAEVQGTRLSRTAQNELLLEVVEQLQMLTGLLDGTISRTNAYYFLRLGHMLERADMTTRIVDVGTGSLFSAVKGQSIEGGNLQEPFENLLWMSVLNSLGAYQMYRQYSLDRVNGPDVVDFLLKDPDFPRSVGFCLAALETSLTHVPEGGEIVRSVAVAQRHVQQLEADEIVKEDLHQFVDDLQVEFINIHNDIASLWFHREAATT